MSTLTGWLDYDRPQLAGLPPSDRVDYFEKRVRLVTINPIHRILANEVHPPGTADSSALLILGVSACCAIEALGKFFQGLAGGNSGRFYAFVHKYMDPTYQTGQLGNMTYAQILWKHFRNGLAHGFSVCHGGFEGGPGAPYFQVKGSALEISPSRLLDDLTRGFDHYLADLRADLQASVNGPLYTTFDGVFDDVFVRGN